VVSDDRIRSSWSRLKVGVLLPRGVLDVGARLSVWWTQRNTKNEAARPRGAPLLESRGRRPPIAVLEIAETKVSPGELCYVQVGEPSGNPGLEDLVGRITITGALEIFSTAAPNHQLVPSHQPTSNHLLDPG